MCTMRYIKSQQCKTWPKALVISAKQVAETRKRCGIILKRLPKYWSPP